MAWQHPYCFQCKHRQSQDANKEFPYYCNQYNVSMSTRLLDDSLPKCMGYSSVWIKSVHKGTCPNCRNNTIHTKTTRYELDEILGLE